jgi:hypothetical protein
MSRLYKIEIVVAGDDDRAWEVLRVAEEAVAKLGQINSTTLQRATDGCMWKFDQYPRCKKEKEFAEAQERARRRAELRHELRCLGVKAEEIDLELRRLAHEDSVQPGDAGGGAGAAQVSS